MKKLPKRQQIRLKGYDYSKDGVYFITICTKDRACILSHIIVGQDAHILPQIKLTPYGKIVETHILLIPGIDSYVIMPNHIHMLIIKSNEVDGTMRASCPTSISNEIRSFKTVVSKKIGKSIWQSRFYDHIIRDDYDYMIHRQYIDENPLKWTVDKYYKEMPKK